MEISFEFSNMEDLATIQHENTDRYLKSVHWGSGKNIVVFSDTIPEPPLEELVNKNKNKISILEAENADLLLDSAIKDMKLKSIEKDLADLTLEVVMGGKII